MKRAPAPCHPAIEVGRMREIRPACAHPACARRLARGPRSALPKSSQAACPARPPCQVKLRRITGGELGAMVSALQPAGGGGGGAALTKAEALAFQPCVVNAVRTQHAWAALGEAQEQTARLLPLPSPPSPLAHARSPRWLLSGPAAKLRRARGGEARRALTNRAPGCHLPSCLTSSWLTGHAVLRGLAVRRALRALRRALAQAIRRRGRAQ